MKFANGCAVTFIAYANVLYLKNLINSVTYYNCDT